MSILPLTNDEDEVCDNPFFKTERSFVIDSDAAKLSKKAHFMLVMLVKPA